MTYKLTEQDLFKLQKELTSQQMIIIKFTADWCKPCKVIQPFLSDCVNEKIKDLDQNFLIREIKRLEPLSTSSVCSNSESIKYALEVNQGWFKKNRIKVFHKIIFL